MAALREVLRAASFAAAVHTRQRRKGAAAEPYINHLIEVAEILSTACEEADPVLLQAALLHDALEDTAVTPEELEAAFGPVVTAVVQEVTDDQALDKAERKRLQVACTPGQSARARQLRIADKISNLRGIVTSPPAHWGGARKRDYFAWAKAVVDGCRGTNPRLEALFDRVHADGLAALDLQARIDPRAR